MARKYHVMAALLNIGVEKRRAVFSNYKADVYEAWQLWLERDVVKRSCFNFRFAAWFSNCTSSKSHHRPTVGQICRFSLLKI